jgi:ribosomal protein L25 (general stress protein Ctc)
MWNMSENLIKARGIEQETLFTLDPDVFANIISSYLYVDDLINVYRTCREMKSQLDESGRDIYKKICLHYQPHSVDDLPAEITCENQYWYKEGKIHREGDLPALIYSDGTQKWYKEGILHRDGDLPAVIYCENQYWYKEGKIHREGDLPALIYSDGTQKWYKEGRVHREGDLPAVIYWNGDQEWYKEGKCHRDGDLPAMIRKNGDRKLYSVGELHW